MKFPGSNLNVLTPTRIAVALAVIAVMAAAGMAWTTYVLFSVGMLRFSAFSIGALLLAGGVLWDARR